MRIKIGTRGSNLALAQTNDVVERLKKVSPETEMEVCVIKTKGDIMQDISLTQIGGQGVFVKEIEEALLSGTIDLAVHSMKDVPGEIPDGLTFAAILPREDPRDVLVSRGNVKLEFMPRGAKIGTGSLRRAAQIKMILPDINIVPLRGNIETRIKKIETENLTSIILAAAAMKRLGYLGKISQYLPVELMLPSVGQGALGVQIRVNDEKLAELCQKLNHRQTATEVAAERSYLRALGGGCRLPIAAYGLIEDRKLTVEGLIASPNGKTVFRDKVRGAVDKAEELGKNLADMIMEKGGKKILDSLN